jgi:hypothetical protein
VGGLQAGSWEVGREQISLQQRARGRNLLAARRQGREQRPAPTAGRKWRGRSVRVGDRKRRERELETAVSGLGCPPTIYLPFLIIHLPR